MLHVQEWLTAPGTLMVVFTAPLGFGEVAGLVISCTPWPDWLDGHVLDGIWYSE